MSADGYSLWADAVLVAHAAIAAFVVGGFAGIVAGQRFGWRWVSAFRFRAIHLALVLGIAAEAWLGLDCPLTVWENWLRRQAGEAAYRGGSVAHWLQALLYYAAPAWGFVLAYSLFAALSLAAWWVYPPRRRQ